MMSYINLIDIMDIEGFHKAIQYFARYKQPALNKLGEQFRKQISFPFVITWTIGWNVMIRDNSND